MHEGGLEPRQTLALLLGASSFRRAPKLAQGRAFYNSAQDFYEYLTRSHGLSLPSENVIWLFDDSRSPSDQLQDFRDFLENRSLTLKSEGLPPQDLIVYYVGHGLFSGPDHAYCLAVRATDERNEGLTSIRAGDLASIIKGSARFLRKFLILDCCFSAAAYKEFQSGPLRASRVKLLDELPQRGTALLCSASAQDPSLAPEGLSRTMFSEGLLNALRQGHRFLGPRLSLSELGDLVITNVREAYPNDWVRPEVHSPDQREGDVASVPLFPNAAYLAEKARAEEEARRVQAEAEAAEKARVEEEARRKQAEEAAEKARAEEEARRMQAEAEAAEKARAEEEARRMQAEAEAAEKARAEAEEQETDLVIPNGDRGTERQSGASIANPQAIRRGEGDPSDREYGRLAAVFQLARKNPGRTIVGLIVVVVVCCACVIGIIIGSTPSYHTFSSIAFATPQSGWIVGDDNVVQHTENGGDTWTQQVVGTSNSSVVFVNANVGWIIGELGDLYHTEDGGVTWKLQASLPGLVKSLVFVTTSSGWAVGFSGKIQHTEDGGKIWKAQNGGTDKDLNSVAFITPQCGWATGDSGTILHTIDGGSTWSKQNSNTTEALNSIVFATQESGWTVGAKGTILHTEDGGSTWEKQTSGTDKQLYSVAFATPRSVWAVGFMGTILHTEDGGSTWVQKHKDPDDQPGNPNNGDYSSLEAIAFRTPQSGWAVGSAYHSREYHALILQTEDGGNIWTQQNVSDQSPPLSSAAKPATPPATGTYDQGKDAYDHKEYAQARTIFAQACDSGESRACNYLGFLYVQGLGGTQDRKTARTVYQKACDRGNLSSCASLGSLYEDARNYAEARKYFKKACDAGLADSCTLLHDTDNRARLADLRRQLADLSVTLTPQNYKIQQLQAQIADLEQQSAQDRNNNIIARRNSTGPGGR